jgi:hypothetical protein
VKIQSQSNEFADPVGSQTRFLVAAAIVQESEFGTLGGQPCGECLVFGTFLEFADIAMPITGLVFLHPFKFGRPLLAMFAGEFVDGTMGTILVLVLVVRWGSGFGSFAFFVVVVSWGVVVSWHPRSHQKLVGSSTTIASVVDVIPFLPSSSIDLNLVVGSPWVICGSK